MIMVSSANPNHPNEAVAQQRTKTIAWHLLLGVLISGLSVWGFIVLWDLVTDRGDQASRFDISILLWMHQHQSPAFTTAARILAFIGSPPFVVGLAVVGAVAGLFRREIRGAAWTLPIAALGSGMLIQVVKVAVHRNRPNAFAPLLHATGYSFPSGHSLIAVVVYGLLGYFAIRLLRGIASRLVITIVTAILIIAIGVSRVYVGVHYPTDVLAGWSAGIPWLIACIWLHERLSRIWAKAGEPILPTKTEK